MVTSETREGMSDDDVRWHWIAHEDPAPPLWSGPSISHQHLERAPNRRSRRAKPPEQIRFGGQFLAGPEGAGLDLVAQEVGDLLVERGVAQWIDGRCCELRRDRR